MRFIIRFLANTNLFVGALLILTPIIYLAFYSFTTSATVSAFENPEQETKIITNDISKSDDQLRQLLHSRETVVIPTNTAISMDNRLKVDSIGIDTLIYEGEQSALALEKGIWRMPEYGTPETNNVPIIIAGHRWGANNLSNQFRAKNLFLNLPNINTGDIIEILWNNNIYKYIVEQIEENTYISRLDDLILVTCKYYNSMDRIFIYAKRI